MPKFPRHLFEARYYILNEDHSITRVKNVEEWAQRFEMNHRQVAENFFGHESIGEVRVSTVFLGLDHSWSRILGGDDDRPVVFETMIFAPGAGDELNGWMDRCCTWDEALVMHAKAVELVKHAFSELQKASGA